MLGLAFLLNSVSIKTKKQSNFSKYIEGWPYAFSYVILIGTALGALSIIFALKTVGSL